MNIKPTTIDFARYWRAGQAALNKERADQEIAKRGTLRGGNTGHVDESGQVAGKCHRLSHLRQLGTEAETEWDRHLMFAAGVSNEDIWADLLSRSWPGKILREEDVPIKWTTTDGTLVTGRPDIVLCDQAGIPQTGLELKLVSSDSTAGGVLAKDTPQLDHVLQAAHYMWRLQIPFILLYTSRSMYPVGWGDTKKAAAALPDALLNPSRSKFNPFVAMFSLWIEDGVIWYSGRTGDVKTSLTVEGIQRYYDRVAVMGQKKSLGPRPLSNDIHGQYQHWNKCDIKYCPLANVCDNYESNYDLWLDMARLELEGG